MTPYHRQPERADLRALWVTCFSLGVALLVWMAVSAGAEPNLMPSGFDPSAQQSGTATLNPPLAPHTNDDITISRIPLPAPVLQVSGIAPAYVTVSNGVSLNLQGVVSITAFTDSAWQLSWPTKLGTNYILQTSGDLTNWTDVRVVFKGDGATNRWLDNTSNEIKFYRLKT